MAPITRLEYKSMEKTGPKPFIFVLMPFDRTFDDIYHLGIKETCEKAGAYAERVDEQVFDGTITQRIYNQISKADIIIADMTGRNPNVFYETGYAHALNKRVILLTQKAEDIPFDLKQWPHIIYENNIQKLRGDLINRLTWAIENPLKDIKLPSIEFYIERISLVNTPSIRIPEPNLGQLLFSIDIHNSATENIHPIHFRIDIISSPNFTAIHWDNLVLNSAKLPDGNIIHVINRYFEIPPEGWDSISLSMSTFTYMLRVGYKHPFILRLLTEGMPIEFPFEIVIVEPTKGRVSGLDGLLPK